MWLQLKNVHEEQRQFRVVATTVHFSEVHISGQVHWNCEDWQIQTMIRDLRETKHTLLH